jgi:uncharacterized protein (TIGR02996 family)
MDEAKALLRAICANPDEDTPRLVYADWLDEHGQSERAEFIRVQCALARIEGDNPQRPTLARREQALLKAHRDEWAKEVPRELNNPYFCRGFVESVYCSKADAFVKHGRALFANNPASEVWMYGAEGPLRDAARCPHLARVRNLGVVNAHREGLEALLASQFATGLRGLYFQYLQVDSPRERLADFTPILALPGLAPLKRLALCFSGFDTTEVRRFALLRVTSGLEELTLNCDSLSDTAVRVLTSMSFLAGLHTLQLQGARLSDASMGYLQSCPHLKGLRRLSLYGAKRVTKDGFRTLARGPYLQNLTDLDLRYTNLTDDDVWILARSKSLPRLSRLVWPAHPRQAPTTRSTPPRGTRARRTSTPASCGSPNWNSRGHYPQVAPHEWHSRLHWRSSCSRKGTTCPGSSSDS